MPLRTTLVPLGKDLSFHLLPHSVVSYREDGEERRGMGVENLLLADAAVRWLNSLGLRDI